ncbi:hypothetical protein [Ottowia sp. VDI28]|uniref:hypothetical protein n=1 Tax=Ottowia sp. VDI28 TaxID=3133968 RepID=UPI003C2BDFEA
MNAHLENNFKRGFFLTEEALIKLDDIIRKRLLAADPNATLQFKVFRADGMLVEFDNPSAVAAEENSSRNAIKRVEILSAGATYKLSLKFDPKDNTDLGIEANDRDLAYLLAADVKDYVNSEILKFRSFSFDSTLSSKHTFPLLMLPFLFISISGIKESPKGEAVAAILESSDVQAKLNFLIESRLGQNPGPIKWYFVAMIVIFVILFFLGTLLDKAYPRNIFYWGKLAQAHDRLVSLREKFVWGVVIAFVIGIASTIAVDYFKNP